MTARPPKLSTAAAMRGSSVATITISTLADPAGLLVDVLDQVLAGLRSSGLPGRRVEA